MSVYLRYFLAVLSGFLLHLGWSDWGSGLFLLIALVPLLSIEAFYFSEYPTTKILALLPYPIVSFLLWNSLNTWWIWNAAPIGAIAAILLNTLMMTTVFLLFHLSRKKIGTAAGYLALLFYWIGMEYFHLNWELSWPWLNLGNGLAKNIPLVQWYEYTGILGGSLWILTSNVLLVTLLNRYLQVRNTHAILVKGILWVLLLVIPSWLSWHRYKHYEEKESTYQFAVIQPNIDPYLDKFDGMSAREQVDRMLELAEAVATDEIDFFIAPETAIPYSVNLSKLQGDASVKELIGFLDNYTQAAWVIGASTRKWYEAGEPHSPTVRKHPSAERYYDNYNSALFLESDGKADVYHKSKLVVGVETMPFPKTMKFLEDLIVDLGGTTGSLGKQAYPSVFKRANDSIRIAPVICYESIYGEYMSGYMRQGAHFIAIITNDGWWDNTPGYKQHLRMAQLRAIESRRSIARSANTGVSCFINQRGDLSEETPFWEPAAIQAGLNANNVLTVYVRYGDFLGRILGFFAILILLYTISLSISKKELKKR